VLFDYERKQAIEGTRKRDRGVKNSAAGGQLVVRVPEGEVENGPLGEGFGGANKSSQDCELGKGRGFHGTYGDYAPYNHCAGELRSTAKVQPIRNARFV
jgi:hypothetical protein